MKARIRELLPAVVVNEVGTSGTVNGTIADELAWCEIQLIVTKITKGNRTTTAGTNAI